MYIDRSSMICPQQYQMFLQSQNEEAQDLRSHMIPPPPTKVAPPPPQTTVNTNDCNYKYLIGQNMGFQT